MGKTIKSVTRAITSAQNALLYGDKKKKLIWRTGITLPIKMGMIR